MDVLDPKNWMKLFALADGRQVLLSAWEDSEGLPALCFTWLHNGDKVDAAVGFATGSMVLERFQNMEIAHVAAFVRQIEGGE